MSRLLTLLYTALTAVSRTRNTEIVDLREQKEYIPNGREDTKRYELPADRQPRPIVRRTEYR